MVAELTSNPHSSSTLPEDTGSAFSTYWRMIEFNIISPRVRNMVLLSVWQSNIQTANNLAALQSFVKGRAGR
jgi:hypothetical protein